MNATRGEDCDTTVESASCNFDCTNAVCGDGYVNAAAGEVCDDTVNDGTGPELCEPNCQAPAQCGNTLVETGEECDPGSVETTACDLDCTFASCGDGTVNLARGEACDTSGESGSCNADCTAVICGDSVVNTIAGEFCDDGINNGTSGFCASDCLSILP